MPIHVDFLATPGGSLGYSLRRRSTGLIYDTTALSFSATPATSIASLTEGTLNYVGIYTGDLASTPSGTFPDDWYDAIIHNVASANAPIGVLGFYMFGGDEVLPGGTAPPTAAAIRTEMDTNSTKLAFLTGPAATASQIPANFSTISITAGVFSATSLSLAPAAPTVTAIRTEMDNNSTKLNRITGNVALASQIPLNLSAVVINSSGVISAAALVNAPGGSAPSAVAIRTEMDTNSTKLAYLTGPVATAAMLPANLNTLGISAGSYDATALVNAPAGGGGGGGGPTAAQIRVEMDTNSTKLAFLTGAVATAAQIPANLNTLVISGAGQYDASALANAPGGTFPTAVAIRTEMDSNSTKLAHLTADVATAAMLPANLATLSITAGAFAMGTFANMPLAPTVAAIRGELDTNSVRLANLTGPVATAASIPTNLSTLGITAGAFDASALIHAPTGGGSAVAVDGSGRVILQPSGLDAVGVESGLNARQALSITAASAAGTLSGTENSAPQIMGAGVSDLRISSVTDGLGNRVTIIHPPA
jgi:hypothetical protein